MLPLGAAGRQTSARMKTKRQFPDDILAVLREGKGLRIRAGTSQHRFIGIWVVVVKDRAFIRSWSVKPSGNGSGRQVRYRRWDNERILQVSRS